jgi:hypothetical protein
MLNKEQKEHLFELLRETLDIGLQSGSVACRSGPWRALFESNVKWDAGVQLNRNLYGDLKRAHIKDNFVREILLAAADIKVARGSGTESQIEKLHLVAQAHGLKVIASTHQWTPCLDLGKGGWANSAANPAATTDGTTVLRNVYVASDIALAETGKLFDEAGEDDLFGALLGIPACCRAAFDRDKLFAAQKQYDFVPYVLNNTTGTMPFDWRLNYLAQYFGFSLLSFFPCSFRCPVAGELASKTLSMITECDPIWAKEAVKLHNSNILYSEYAGLHLFHGKLREGQLEYKPYDIISTAATDLSQLLQQGDRLRIKDKNHVEVFHGSTKISDLSKFEISMCVFK